MEIDKFFKTDDLIYHYTKYTTAIEKILYDKKLKLSSLRDTNDPREYKFMLFNAIGWNLSDSITIDLNKATSFINHRVANFYKMACFCMNSNESNNNTWSDNFFDYGFARSRMWSQYCDNYGVCLAFSKTKLIKYLSKLFKGNIYYGEVDYVIDPSLELGFRNLDANKLIEADLGQYTIDHVTKYRKDLFFRKQLDYRDENEFRVVVYQPDSNFVFIDISEFISAIILGDRFPKAYRKLMIRYASDFNVTLKKIEWSHGEPFLLDWEN